jgi:BlaI family transcriptional regulator, penicillinase repressor
LTGSYIFIVQTTTLIRSKYRSRDVSTSGLFFCPYRAKKPKAIINSLAVRKANYEIYRKLYFKYVHMSTKAIKPTESELEILQVLWVKNQASVREVHEELLKSKEAGYTTTLKLMQIMHEKGLVRRDDSAKTHIYQASVSKERTQKHLLGKMINTLFGGSSTELVIQALGNHKASPAELEEIQQLLNDLKQQ